MAQQYKAILQETVVSEFIIEADSPEEARAKAERDYRLGKLVATPGECQETQIRIADTDGKMLTDFREI